MDGNAGRYVSRENGPSIMVVARAITRGIRTFDSVDGMTVLLYGATSLLERAGAIGCREKRKVDQYRAPGPWLQFRDGR
ncbi:hypothetical protein RE428_16120 [Marinobacter nanhaiticus D15-8W]|nr:hypothetical protein RE428_16120 [Marinobacter nanhaiticus D15-8W]